MFRALRNLLRGSRTSFLVSLALASVVAVAGFAQDREGDERGRENGDERERRRGDRRQRWDPASFLQRLDRNGNKILEVDEMSGRAQGFISNLGFDTANPIPMDNVIAKINRDRSDADAEEAARAAQAKKEGMLRLVPDFGEAVELPSVPGFGTDGGSTQTVSAKTLNEASDSVRSQVERVLQQYDENRNGALDANEIANASWGQPSPAESDLNRDGRLTQDELIGRYEARERDNQRMNGASDDGNNARRDERREERRSSENRRGLARDDSSNDRAGGSSTNTVSSRSSTSTSDRIAAYVNGQIQKYDSNRNGALDADELSQMSNPPKNADGDGDGSLSRPELEQYYGGGYKSPSSASSNATSGGDNANGDDSARRDSESSSRNSSDRFRRRDSEFRGGGRRAESSSDGTVRMSEFEPDEPWSEEKLKRFYELDANGDGVITPTEFNRGG